MPLGLLAWPEAGDKSGGGGEWPHSNLATAHTESRVLIRMNKLRLLLLVALALTGGCSQIPQVEKIKVTDFGIYTAERDSSIKTPNTASGVTHGVDIDTISLSETTRTIPARMGIHFGFRYSIIGAPSDADVDLHVVNIFPSPGLVNPATQVPRMRDDYVHTGVIGEECYHDYSFDHDWELVPGTWTFQIWYQDRKLAEQSFNVVRE